MTPGACLLLIEDDAAIAHSLRDGLEREGYTVAWKASGAEGMQHAREQNPHLIILEDLPYLFSRFHRRRNASAYPGSGLGLAIVKAIAQGHDGEVTAESTNKGARFCLKLPL